MYENTSVEQQPPSQQLSPMSNKSMITSSSINENHDPSYSQQLRDTQVAIKLVDCMQCLVRIPQCQIEEQNSDWDKNTKTLEQQLRERREEEEKTSQQPRYSQRSSKADDEEEEFLGEGLNIEDFNAMENYIFSQ